MEIVERQTGRARTARVRSYEGLADELRRKILQGEWKAGTMLPSRIALSRDYGVSATTVQQAIAQMMGEGLLTADGGRGTFVAAAEPETPIDASLSVDGLILPGRRPGSRSITRGPIAPGLVIGILDTNVLISTDAVRADGYGWVDSIATQMENTFDQVGGHTHWFSPSSSGAAVSPEAALDYLFAQEIDALAIISMFDGIIAGEELLARIGSMPCVYISWHPASAAMPHLYYDNRLAGYFALQHLVKQGYSRYAFLSMEAQAWSEERLEGMREHRFEPVSDQLILKQEHWVDEARRTAALGRWLDEVLGSAPAGETGIIAGNDWMAMHLIDIARLRGLRHGADFGIIGFDNHPMSRDYGLTTLRPPLEAMGMQAAEMLFNQIQGDRTQVEVRLRSQLLPRASTHR